MPKPSQAKLQQAIVALGINVPIMRAEAVGDGVRLHLYGHAKPVEWHPPKPKAKPKAKGGD
jgi:hypothetical protein